MQPSSIFKTAFVVSLMTAAWSAQALELKVYSADEHSFSVNSTLVYGNTSAMVIDAGFTRADALRIAANVLDSGKTLKTIYVSQADPDYYFGVETLKSIFPEADVVTTPAVLKKMQEKLQNKLDFWGPKMGVNAPKNPVLPRALSGNTLTVDGETIEIHGTEGVLANRPYAWIPSLKAIVGAIGVYNGRHVWTADTPTPEERQAWKAQLNEMQALEPKVVVPGHMKAGAALDASAITYTQQYLDVFEKNLAESKNATELIERMKKAYPEANGALALEIGAKVNKGEMKW